MGEVAVHLHHVARSVLESVAEARQVGGADPVLLRAVQDLDPLVRGGERVGELARPVG